MGTNAKRALTKAAVAAAVVGGGHLLTAGQAGAQDVPAPNPLDEVGQRLLAEYGPRALAFVDSLKPADDPNTAETTAGPDGATGTAYQSPADSPLPIVFGRSEAGPGTAKVTVLRIGETDLLTKEAGPDGTSAWGGELAPVGGAIDKVNEQTCPSGGHGGEDLCITFFDAKAEVIELESEEPVEITRNTHDLIDASGASSTVKRLAKAILVNNPVTLKGTTDGESTQSRASFDLVRASKGADSVALLPTSANYDSLELGDATLKTELQARIFGQTVKIPVSIPVNNLPPICSSSGQATTIEGTGVFADVASFLGTPSNSSWGNFGSSGGNSDACQVSNPT